MKDTYGLGWLMLRKLNWTLAIAMDLIGQPRERNSLIAITKGLFTNNIKYLIFGTNPFLSLFSLEITILSDFKRVFEIQPLHKFLNR